ncbi:MAG: hypothetical protein FJ023_01045 [Chloroflexi bacterium]|nr:hypothetical protein [Chloroflexota bacterium]
MVSSLFIRIPIKTIAIVSKPKQNQSQPGFACNNQIITTDMMVSTTNARAKVAVVRFLLVFFIYMDSDVRTGISKIIYPYGAVGNWVGHLLLIIITPHMTIDTRNAISSERGIGLLVTWSLGNRKDNHIPATKYTTKNMPQIIKIALITGRYGPSAGVLDILLSISIILPRAATGMNIKIQKATKYLSNNLVNI